MLRSSRVNSCVLILANCFVYSTISTLNKVFGLLTVVSFALLGVSQHPKLQWLTLVACSHESKAKQFHEWIPLKKEKNKKEEFLATIFPTMKRADIATLAVITTDREIKDYCQNLGWDKKEVNAIKF